MAKGKVVVEAAEGKVISTGYTPRTHQYRLHQLLKRFSVIICHRRFGKTVFALNHLINAALTCTRAMPRFAYLAPNYGQAKRVAWDYVKSYTGNIPGVEYNEAELRVDFPNGARIQLLSGENPMSLKGIYLDGVVLDEYGDMNPTVWGEVVRPTLSDRKGWALFIGTVKGENHFWEMFTFARDSGDKEWFAALYKASETGIIDKEELDSARRQMTEEEFNQEYECDPRAGLVGAYFAKELSKADREVRIRDVPHDPQYPVDTYWDLGLNDTTAIWFVQSSRFDHRFIDYYEISGMSLPEIVAEIRKKPYNFDHFVLPHDAEVRDLSTGRSRKQMMYDLGCRRIKVVPRIGKKIESINAARVIFSKCYFDKTNCKLGLKALANYQRRWDAKNNVFQESPLHNWASNGADAFQQFAMGSMEGGGRLGLLDGRATLHGEYAELEAEMDYNPYQR